MKIAFIGHRKVHGKDVADRLREIVKEEILKGNNCFTMGTHGDFDAIALWCCRDLRKSFPEIEVVITSINQIKKDKDTDYKPYSDVKTVMYDIEDEHFKN